MKIWMGLVFSVCVSSFVMAENSFVYPHDEIKQYSMHGNFQKGLSTKSMGAKQFEIWRASIDVGSKTPRHVHETEEVFVLLKGELLVIVGDEVTLALV